MKEINNLDEEIMAIVGMKSMITRDKAIKQLAETHDVGIQSIKKEIKIIEDKIFDRNFEVMKKGSFTDNLILSNGMEASIPYPYSFNEYRINKLKITKTRKDEYESYERVLNAIAYISAFTKNHQTGEEGVELTYILDKDQDPRKLVVSWTSINSVTKILALGNLGIPVNSVNAHSFISFLDEFVGINRQKIPTIKVVEACGLHKIEGEWHYVYGNKVISKLCSKNKIVKNNDASVSISATAIHSEGEASLWVEAMLFFNKYDLSLFSLGAVLAAPLMKYFNLSPFIIHIYGNSSQGKSTVLKVAGSFVGDIGPQGLVLSWNCSPTGAEARLADFNGGAAFFDDLSQSRGDETVKGIVYMIGNSRGAQRGTITGGSQKVASFSGIALSSGEAPIIRNESLQGMVVRVLEFDELPFGEKLTTDELVLLDKYSDSILSNYGHFYEPYIQNLIEGLNTENELHNLQIQFNNILNEMKNSYEYNNFGNRILPNFAVIKLALLICKDFIPELALTEHRITECVHNLFESRLSKLDRNSNIDFKALLYVINRVVSNPRGFRDDENQAEQWGRYILGPTQEIDSYAITPAKIYQLLREGAFEPESIVGFFKQNKWIEFDKNGGLKTISFPGQSAMRCYVFKVELLKKLGVFSEEEKNLNSKEEEIDY